MYALLLVGTVSWCETKVLSVHMREMEGVHKQDMRKLCIVIGGDYSWNALQKEFSAHEDTRI